MKSSKYAVQTQNREADNEPIHRPTGLLEDSLTSCLVSRSCEEVIEVQIQPVSCGERVVEEPRVAKGGEFQALCDFRAF